MQIRYFLIFLVVGLYLTGCDSNNKTEQNSPPNIILILADDLGYSDIGSYGGEIDTPNLDRLADKGLRFSQFYNTSRCWPTRGSLMTGLYPHQAGVGGSVFDQHTPGYRGHLTDNTVTIAEVLKKSGYNTGMVGKWHLSNPIIRGGGRKSEEQMEWLAHQTYYPEFSPLEQYPVHQGFEKFYGNIWGVVDFFDPFSLVSGSEPVRSVPDDYYHTDAISDSAASYIHQFSKDDRPFFLYVAETAPHWPLQAPQEAIEKYEDTYKEGWQAIREARYQRMVDMGLVNPETTPLSPRWKSDLTWEENPTKEWDARAMAVHAAMIDIMDQGIGRMLDALEETGEMENTLILFLSDNGASSEDAQEYGPGYDRPGETREGDTIIYPVDKEALPGPQTVFASIGQRWSNVSNTPFRYWKMESYEGGVRTPLIAYWPEGITAPKGSITDQRGHIMDIMATVLDITDATYPKQFKGHEITPLEGKSLLPIFRGEQREGHKVLFNEHARGAYVREDNWKAVKLNTKDPWKLYDMSKDQTELQDLAGEYPQKVQYLDSLWQQWARETQVLPRPGSQ